MSRQRLVGREHAERRAGLKAERLDGRHHGADRVEVAFLRRTPCRAHAEPARALGLGGARLRDDGGDVHQPLGRDAGVVARALRAIGAVFRAAAGLDRQQCRDLHLAGIEMDAVDALGVKDQIRERQFEQRADFRARPVMAHDAGEAMRRRGPRGWGRQTGTLIHAATMAAAGCKCKPGCPKTAKAARRSRLDAQPSASATERAVRTTRRSCRPIRRRSNWLKAPWAGPASS